MRRPAVAPASVADRLVEPIPIHRMARHRHVRRHRSAPRTATAVRSTSQMEAAAMLVAELE
jgi:hypothetical protein